MKKFRLRSVFISLVMVLLIVPMLTLTAYARTDDTDEDEDDLSDILIPIPIVVTPDPRPEPRTLTPDGNMNLVDDVRVDTIEEKQFITVTTRNGNYFYIIIDRAGNSENVYFLNMVDELDLLALLDDDVVLPEPQPPADQYTPLPILPTEPEPEPTSEPEKDSNGNIIALVVFLFIGGIGAAVYFKVIKPKQAVNSGLNFDEFKNTTAGEDEFNGGGIFADEVENKPVLETVAEPEVATAYEPEEITDEEPEIEVVEADDFPAYDDLYETEDEEEYESEDEE